MLFSNAAPAVGGSISILFPSDIAEAPKLASRPYRFWPRAGAGWVPGLPCYHTEAEKPPRAPANTVKGHQH